MKREEFALGMSHVKFTIRKEKVVDRARILHSAPLVVLRLRSCPFQMSQTQDANVVFAFQISWVGVWAGCFLKSHDESMFFALWFCAICISFLRPTHNSLFGEAAPHEALQNGHGSGSRQLTPGHRH